MFGWFSAEADRASFSKRFRRSRIGGELRRQDLDRDLALEPRVPRPIHLAHPARAERRQGSRRARGASPAESVTLRSVAPIGPTAAPRRGRASIRDTHGSSARWSAVAAVGRVPNLQPARPRPRSEALPGAARCPVARIEAVTTSNVPLSRTTKRVRPSALQRIGSSSGRRPGSRRPRRSPPRGDRASGRLPTSRKKRSIGRDGARTRSPFGVRGPSLPVSRSSNVVARSSPRRLRREEPFAVREPGCALHSNAIFDRQERSRFAPAPVGSRTRRGGFRVEPRSTSPLSVGRQSREPKPSPSRTGGEPSGRRR